MSAMDINLGPLAPHSWAEIIAGFVFLALMWFVFAKFVSPMFEKMYQERASQIEGGMMRAQQAEEAAAAAKKQYEDQLAGARQDAANLRDEAKAQAALVVAKMHDDAVKESNRLISQGRQQVAAEKAEARDELRTEIGGLATTLAGRIVGRTLSDKQAASATIDEFLAELSNIDTREVPVS